MLGNEGKTVRKLMVVNMPNSRYNQRKTTGDANMMQISRNLTVGDSVCTDIRACGKTDRQNTWRGV
jgi:hypothetical protein